MRNKRDNLADYKTHKKLTSSASYLTHIVLDYLFINLSLFCKK